MRLVPLVLPPALVALVVTFVACSSTNVVTVPVPATDGGVDAGTEPTGEDAGPDPAAYTEAVWSARWTKIAKSPTAPKGAKMDDIVLVSPKVGFAANGPGFAIEKTEDGGETWKPFRHAGTYFRAVAFLDESHGFAGNLGAGLSADISDENPVYETKDSGKTWAPVTAITGPKPDGICNFSVVDKSTVFAVGRANGPTHLMVTEDAGGSWKSIDLAEHLTMAIDAHFTSKNDGLVVGMGTDRSCVVIRTTDGGASFKKVFASKTANSLCWKIQFPSEKVGYVAVQDSTNGPATIAKTIDGGETWKERKVPFKVDANNAYPMIGVGFITDEVGWAAPEDAALPVYRTRDGGETWEVDPTLKAPINRFRFVDRSTAFAIGGAIWKLSIDAPASEGP